MQINIPPISETNHKLMYVSQENVESYEEPSPVVQVIQGTTAADISKMPTV